MEANKKQTGIFFWALLAVSFLVRLIRINQGFWYDELHTLLRFVFSSYQQILTSLPVPNNHILFTLLAKLSIGIFGLHEWSLRLPSLILGGLTPPLLYLFWRKRFSRFVSFAASLFLALSFWPVWFSQDARGYAGFILFSALSNIFFLSWLERPERNPGGLYVICSAIACYFYFYTGFIIAAQFAYAMVRLVRSGKPLKPRKYFLPLPAALISMALYAPGLSQLLKYYQLRGKDISFHWLNLQFAKDTIELLAGTHWLSFAVGAAILFLVGLPRLYKKWPGLVFLYLASAAFLILATWVLRIFIYARFLSFLIPFFFLAAAAAMEWIGENISARTTRLRKNHAAGFMAAVYCLFLALSLIRYYQLGKQGFKDAAKYISHNYPGRDVISFGLGAYEYRYYDRYADPFLGHEELTGKDLDGKLVVASHRFSWSARNTELLRKACSLEKVWESAGPEENFVYLYRCFEPARGNQTGR